MKKPVIIISQPKSGTYLLSEVIKNLGVTQTYMHLTETRYSQYDKDKIEEGREKPFFINEKLSYSSSLIKPGEFAVGHLQKTENTTFLFKNFLKIIITRDLEQRRESWSSFFNGEIRRKADFVDISVKEWAEEENVFHITFEEIINENTDSIDNLQQFLFAKVILDSSEVLKRSLAAETITKSNKRRV